jgi:IS30 family transposase
VALFTEVERVEVWDRRRAGESNRLIGRRLGWSAGSIRAMVESSGGVRLAVRRRSVRDLSLVEREEISRGVAAGESLRVLARRLDRSPSTISRELARNGGRRRYRAYRADRAAWHRARRPQGCKLVSNHTLRAVVEELLTQR